MQLDFSWLFSETLPIHRVAPCNPTQRLRQSFIRRATVPGDQFHSIEPSASQGLVTGSPHPGLATLQRA